METQKNELELLQNSINAMSDNLQEIAAKMTADKNAKDEKTLGDFDEKFSEVNSLILKQNELITAQQNSIDDLLQKAVSGSKAKKEYNSFGEKFVAEFHDKGGKVECNAIKTTDLAGGVYRWGGVESERIRWTLFDLIPVSYINDTSIRFTKQVAIDNKARPVDESQVKPHSHLTFAPAESTLRTIAHYEMVTRQALKTESELKNIINNELYNGLVLATENQIINGTGGEVTQDGATYTEWNGLLTQATAFDDTALPSDSTLIDRLRFAMAQVIAGRGWADGVILNPIDWAKIETAKVNANGTGAYIIGDPVNGTARRLLWGLPVVDTQAMAAGDFVVGAFKTAARVFLQSEGVVFIDGYINDQLIKNEMTIVAELMGNVGVKKPLQIVKGSFA